MASHLGGTVESLKERMGCVEFAYWIARYKLHPFGDQHDELRFGVLASLAYNPYRKERSKALGPEDFFPSLKKPEDVWETREGQIMALKLWTKRLGGKVIKAGENGN